jgi:hypothetical protein
MNNDFAALANAKTHLAQATTAAAAKQTLAASVAAQLDACRAVVLTETQARAGAVAAAKPSLVIEADAKLLHANIAAEIVEARAATIRAECDAAAVEVHAAKAEVSKTARAVRAEERSQRLARFEAAFDHMMTLGQSLEFFCGPISERPADIVAALAKIPRPDPINTPVNELRGFASTRAWDERLRELMADDAEHVAEAVAA